MKILKNKILKNQKEKTSFDEDEKIQYLLSTYYVLSTMLRTGNTNTSKTEVLLEELVLY